MRHSAVEIEDDDLAIVKKVNVNVEDGSVINALIKYLKALSEDFAVDEVEKDKRGLIRQTNFDRRKAVIVPDLAYMGKGDWSPKELLVFPKVLMPERGLGSSITQLDSHCF
ncbi:hypothetical protein Gotur_031860 [Gossypium turneri]